MVRFLPLLALLAACGSPGPVDADPAAVTALDADAADKTFTPPNSGYYVDHQLAGPYASTCGFTVSETARLNVQIADGVVSSGEEFLSAAQVLAAKLALYSGAPVGLGGVCSDLLSSLEAIPRQGDCPDVTGAAVHTSNAPLAAAMNVVQDEADPTMVGKWCKVELVGAAASDARNLWWSVIYGMQNYTAAAVLHNDGTSPAIWRLRYFVPVSASQMYAAFLESPSLATAYPSGATFQLGINLVGSASNGATSTSELTLGAAGKTWTVIDPEDEDAIRALDAFVAGQVGAGALADYGCASVSGFPRSDRGVTLEGWSPLRAERGCR